MHCLSIQEFYTEYCAYTSGAFQIQPTQPPAACVPLLHNMPGILPMKVIKVGGTGTTSRIAQACDRCRSKKIRCDGVRPCCSQCANVGFECRTSDKLSRRAFPRGYTESLEERVRSLETEVKDLKDLLDEKDEKIDVLSRIHSFTPPHRAASARSPSASATVKSSTSASSDGVFHVERSTTRPSQRSQNPFIGFSSTQGFAGMLYLSLSEWQQLTYIRRCLYQQACQ